MPTSQEAIYADQIGMRVPPGSASIISIRSACCRVDLVLAYVAAQMRLAPAFVLPLHRPIRVAEQWATLDLLSGGRVDFASGRGYDRREYLPFHVSFEDNQGLFEGHGSRARSCSVVRAGPHLALESTIQFDDVRITPISSRYLPISARSQSRRSNSRGPARLRRSRGAGGDHDFSGLKQVADLYRNLPSSTVRRTG